EQEQHAECLFCEISSGFKTYFEPTQTEVSHQQGKVSSFEDQVPRPQFHGWAFVCLRGPPAAVFV
ncbi:MAG: hypothetical protein QGH51_10430, partial [Planctomycetota bacterium]|nr:hypothetical protein [Planctomycetota bacterium]